MIKNKEPTFKHLSPSSIETWFQCQQKWFRQHYLRMPYVTNYKMFKGSLYHKTLEYFYMEKAVSGRVPKKKPLVEKTRDYFETKIENQEIDWEDTKPEDCYKDCQTASELHIKKRGRFIVPGKSKTGEPFVEIEKRAVIPGDNPEKIELMGRIDLITDDGNIVDHKTKNMKKYARKLTLKDMQNKLQPRLYKYMLPKATAMSWEVALFNPGGEPTIYTITHPEWNPPKDMGVYLNNVMKQMQMSIESGIFLPNTAHMFCDERWCQFYDDCQKGVL